MSDTIEFRKIPEPEQDHAPSPVCVKLEKNRNEFRGIDKHPYTANLMRNTFRASGYASMIRLSSLVCSVSTAKANYMLQQMIREISYYFNQLGTHFRKMKSIICRENYTLHTNISICSSKTSAGADYLRQKSSITELRNMSST